MPLYEERPEVRATSGVGCALYAKNSNGFFSFMLALETVPAFKSTPEAIEINVTTSRFITKIEGKTTLEEKEIDFFLHRDSIRTLKAMDGKIVELLRVNPDYTGERCNCQISFTSQDATASDPNKGSLKITPVEYLGYVDNCYELIQPTCKFVAPIDAVVEIEGTGKREINITTNPAEATLSATSETPEVATVNATAGKLTITGVKAGTSIVVLKAEHDGYAPWETTVLVIVK